MLEQYVHALAGTLAPCVLVMILSALFNVGEGSDRPRSHSWRYIGVSVGIVISIVFSLLRTFAIIDRRSVFNLPILIICVITDCIVLITICIAHNITADWRSKPWMIHVANAAGAVNIAAAVIFAFPDVILQLTRVIEPGTTPFTSDMLLRSLGFVLGIATSVITAAVLYTLRTPHVRRSFTIAALLSMGITILLHITELVVLLINMMLIRVHGVPFRALILVHNATITLTLAQSIVFILPIIASIRVGCTAQSLPQANQAQQRQTSALRRRAWSTAIWSMVMLVGVSIALTVGVAQTRIVPTLSAPEEYTLQSDKAIVSFEQVADGHLHRFAYKAKDGTMMRFIVIKKNGGAYGVALDACETCGDAGYYEKNGKIICKRCDVAINLATIGFKGGCNPIPVQYTASDGQISIHTADLDALSSHFK